VAIARLQPLAGPNERGLEVIKVVIAYIDSDKFETIRRELADYGITYISAIAAGGASEDSFVAPNYHGSPQTLHLAEKIRLECVVGATHVKAVTEMIFKHEAKRSFVFVMNVEEAIPEEFVMSDTEAAVS
jgi:nitrogen regulatory protein PII